MRSASDALRNEYRALHRELSFIGDGEPLRDAAREIVRGLSDHLAKEEEFALPLLDALANVLRDNDIAPHHDFGTFAEQLKLELPIMTLEMQSLMARIDEFADAAKRLGDPDKIRIADRLRDHLLAEAEILHPLVVLIGDYLTSVTSVVTAARWPDRGAP